MASGDTRSGNRRAGRWLAIAVAVLAIVIGGSIVSAGQEHAHGTPEPRHGHDGPATPGSQDHVGESGTGAVYLTIANEGDTDDALVGGVTDRALDVQLHETVVDGGVGRMLPHDGAVTVPADESVAFEPGGLHIMLVGLTDDIRLGDTFDVTLTFERAGEVTIPVTAVLDPEEADGEPVEAGDLVIEGTWSRPAPMIGDAPGTPAATPTP